MSLNSIPFQQTDWESIPATVHKGETGEAYWRTKEYAGLRIRRVEYSAGYKADHWCEKGHIVYCLEGEMVTELSNGSSHLIKKGMSYEVSDGMSSHRSTSEHGATILIIDGAFLR